MSNVTTGAEERLHFDTIARLYDTVRPGYPEMLFDDLLALSGVQAPAAVLDVGCGTGKSTEPLARRGHSVVALDPGQHMLDLCKHNLRQYSNVSFVHSTFEEWEARELRFDIITSGTALHWVTEAAQQRLSALLTPHGCVGIFWHTFLNGQEPVFSDFDQIYRTYSPENYVSDFHATQEMFDRRREIQVLSLQGFSSWRVIRYYTELTLDSGKYIDLMRTWSTHRASNDALFTAVRDAIERHGGKIRKPIRTSLCVGKRTQT